MLNKQICFDCRKKLRMKIYGPDLPDDDIGFDIAWKEGTCPCPYAFEDTTYVSSGIALCISNSSSPPRKCPYVVEHIVSQ
jgi:hypothetical protein